MAQCPACATEVAIDFGMATCPQCSLVFMVGIDGAASMPEEAPSDEAYGEEASAAESIVEQDAGDSLYDATAYQESEYESPLAFSDEATAMESESVADENDSLYDMGSEPTEMISSMESFGESNEETQYNENFITDMSQETVIDDPEATEIMNPQDPLGVQSFDKSRASQLVDGPYYYDVTVQGLDTPELKDQVMEALQDQRFQWTSEDIKKNFRNGALVLKNLNPIKAVLLVIKLQHIDVDISWKQKLHTDSSVGEGTVG